MKNIFLIMSIMFSVFNLSAQQTIVQFLSGTDKDHTVKWDFLCTTGRNSNKWSAIPVPSCWEMQGFGTYNYYQDKENPDEQGLYKFQFKIIPKQEGKKVVLVFDASMTDTEVRINGKSAGAIHQGSFYQFKYDITSLIYFDKANLLEVKVSKKSSNASINKAERKADFWLFGGIFRPVYLEFLPQTFIERIAIDAKANGDFNMQIFSNANAKQVISAQLFDMKNKAIGKSFQMVTNDSMLHHHFTNIKLWNPEQPNLYKVVVSIKDGIKIVHSINQRFGFRTAELREKDGFYVNGKKVIFKGVCRHSEWPETGRTLSRQVHLMDIKLMKDMNMNAVRMSHYPPDKEFLDLCDSLGLFVLDELTGWQAAYDTLVGKKLVKEMIVRDVNHPSIVIWDNGNEGGWNRSLDGDYNIYDLQKRQVIHPWERFRGTNTKHYPDFKYIQNEVANPKEVFFPTEFMHGLFDGGHGAALEDFWNEMMKHPYAAGGFLWSLHDEGVVRNDRHDSIDVAGNAAPDGIVGPHREKEGSYFTIKEIWSPVYIDTKINSQITAGNIEVENRYLFTNLNKCKFDWKLVNFSKAADKFTTVKIVQKASSKLLFVAPGNKAILKIPFPFIKNADALYLSALDEKGDTICTWSWAIQTPEKIIQNIGVPKNKSSITSSFEKNILKVFCDGITYEFDKSSGYLQNVIKGNKIISLNNGPALAGSKQILADFKTFQEGNIYTVMPIYAGDSLKVKWLFESGKLPKLLYSYLTKDTASFMGITFNYPEEKINGVKWLGRGPYHVWKNRLKGQQLGVWQKKYNNTITGQNWNYPEFKGWYSSLYWVTLQNNQSDFTIYTDQQNIYLEMLQPEKPKAAGNENTSPAFPEGNIGFMHGISPIGTKFQSADVMGPMSQKNIRVGSVPLTGTLYFDFR